MLEALSIFLSLSLSEITLAFLVQYTTLPYS